MAAFVAAAIVTGCTKAPVLIPRGQLRPIDRSLVEYPSGYQLRTLVRNLTCPTAICFDSNGSLIIADRGMDRRPRIIGYRQDGTAFSIYPQLRKLPFRLVEDNLLYGPVGGMTAVNGKVYVLHRNAQDRGALTAFDYDGTARTLVGDLPTEGEHGVLDLVLNRHDGRLYFALGSMTNSGVVGLDNWAQGWVDRHHEACDIPGAPLRLLGFRFDTANPMAGLFGGSDTSVTAPFQPLGSSSQMWIRPGSSRPTAAIYSVSTGGGDLRVEAHGIRCARGLAFNDFGRLYATNQGMELRGTRPVKDDPDALLRIVRSTWYGWPDFSADLQPITLPHFQPPTQMVVATGYPELASVIDHQVSGLLPPDRSTLVQAVFRPLSGAAKMDFVPSNGPMQSLYGSAIVALSGDRAPFATSGQPLLGPIGYKVVQVDVDSHQIADLICNARNGPASAGSRHEDALERPFDVKFAPDGALYILDLGRLEMKGARAVPIGSTGKILRLEKK